MTLFHIMHCAVAARGLISYSIEGGRECCSLGRMVKAKQSTSATHCRTIATVIEIYFCI